MPQASRRTVVSLAAALLLLGSGVAQAGQVVEEAGVMVCVIDKWDEKEPEKGHKLVDYAGRCVSVPDDAAAQKSTDECTGKYEYMPEGSFKASGTCTTTFKQGDQKFVTWEEGSHLKASIYRITGGTGKFKGATGEATYTVDELTSALFGGRYQEKMELP